MFHKQDYKQLIIIINKIINNDEHTDCISTCSIVGANCIAASTVTPADTPSYIIWFLHRVGV